MYLKNDICKLKPLFNIDFSKKTDIISACFFKMSGGGYTNFDKYLTGIFNLKKFIDANFKSFKLRVFIDPTIYNDKKIMNKLNSHNIDLVLYECPKFIKDGYHRGIFGTIVRFFPMFDFENNDANDVIISDIDLNYFHQTLNMLKLKDKLVDIKKHNLDDIYTYFYGTLRDMSIIKKGFIIPYILASEQINFKRIDKSVILNYLDNYNKYKDRIIEIFNHSLRKIEKSNDEFLIYGWDEYFINYNYINYIIKNKKAFMVTYSYFITINLYYINTKRHQLMKEEKSILKDFYLDILKDNKKFKYVDEKNSFFFIDKLFFDKDLNSLTKDQIDIAVNIYKFYIKNFSSEKIIKLFGIDFVKIILSDYYLGKIKFEEDKIYNSKEQFINVNYNELPKDEIIKLKEFKNKYNLSKVLI